MRKLFVTEFVTLDGVMEAPGGEPSHPHTGWVSDYPGEEHMQFKFDETFETETLLVGRVTYESFAGAWPTYEGPMADKMNAMEKFVVSNTITDPEWNNTSVIAGDAVEGVRKLKETDGGLIQVAGSATLVHTLLDAGLVDELRLLRFPVSIGGGIRVFPDTRQEIRWELAEATDFPAKVRLEIYRPEAA
jgi:dihydrofolate reductase